MPDFVSYRYTDASQTVIMAERVDGTFLAVEAHMPEWAAAVGAAPPLPAPTQEELASERRANMQPLTRLQLALASLNAGLISQAEAEAWAATGALPAAALTAIAALPVEQQAEARIRAVAAGEIGRMSPVIAVMAGPAGFNLTDAQVDALFEAGAAL